MALCACGCGQAIEPLPHHKYRPPKYIPGHWQRTGDLNRGKRTAGHRIPEGGTPCACGCGMWIPEFHPSGAPRYAMNKDGRFYVRGHSAVSGEQNAQWRGGRYMTSMGYIVLTMPGHHLADKHGAVREHRLVWEQTNGRRLEPWEDVHHINGDKSDNRPENLVALTRSEHAKVHGWNPGHHNSAEQRREDGRKGAEARWGKSKS